MRDRERKKERERSNEDLSRTTLLWALVFRGPPADGPSYRFGPSAGGKCDGKAP